MIRSIALATARPDRYQIQFGWFALVIPVIGLAIRTILAGFTAEDRVREKCHSQVMQIRDAVMTAEVRGTLALIAVKVHPHVHWPTGGLMGFIKGEPGDPEIEAERVIGGRVAEFGEPLASLERQMARIRDATTAHARLVKCAQRSAVSMGLFLPCWIYVSLCLLLPNVRFPTWSTIAGVAVLATSAGWAACSWWFGNHERNSLSVIVREAPTLPGGTTQ